MHGCLDCHGNGSAKRETHSRAAEDKTISRLAIRSPSTEWRRLAQLDGWMGEWRWLVRGNVTLSKGKVIPQTLRREKISLGTKDISVEGQNTGQREAGQHE